MQNFIYSSKVILAIAVLVAIWKLAALSMASDIALPQPEQVATAIWNIIQTKHFISTVFATSLRGLSAFFISIFIGIAIGFFSALSDNFYIMFKPILTVIRATPVLAIILLALIWFPAGIVPVFSAIIMAFPVVASAIYSGLKNNDEKLINMAKSFGVSKRNIALHIRLPSILSHGISAANNALGLCWKVVVAGEVLSQPQRAIGTSMNVSRIMLETADVFAWAGVGIMLCSISDTVFNIIIKKIKWTTV